MLQRFSYSIKKIFFETIPSIRFLHEETKSVPIGLGLLNQTRTKVVRSSPCAKVPNVLRVQTDGLTTKLVQLFIPKSDLGRVDGGREDAELGLRAHLKRRPAIRSRRWLLDCCAGSLGDDKIGAYEQRNRRATVDELATRVVGE